MSDVAVRAETLGKQFHIGRRQEAYRTLRDSLSDSLMAPFRRASKLLHGHAYGASELDESIWALKDVSFEIAQGEVVGIIGRNGAGKSTLLKILSRITEPTEGYVDVYGRVGALLEVGTGFHPELTGRENIYLNGAILGMSRAEIGRKFDEMVDFAEIEKFIDTPVKHYSSGMALRLGFAVAAHLEPEILVVDEVLAVGDAAFQQKCLGKMGNVAHEGRTVLFVSHSMPAVSALCQRGIVLDSGQLDYSGPVGQAISHYLNKVMEQSDDNLVGHHKVTFGNVRVNGENTTTIDMTRPFDVSVTLFFKEPVDVYTLHITLQDTDNHAPIVSRIDNSKFTGRLESGKHTIQVSFPALWLRPNVYTMQFMVKMLTASGEKRYRSDPYYMEVTGNSDPDVYTGFLTPVPTWSLLEPIDSPR